MPTYVALLRKDPNSDFGVDFPDFPGCITAGSTLEEARHRAEEALAGHIGCMLDLGQSIPRPSSLEEIMADPDNADALPFAVTVSEPARRPIKVSFAMPEPELRAIDEWAKRHGLSRSKALAMAARRLLAETD
jgi:predicted RNase H-like HicB family nuclease